jgi:hypothetical protein
VPPIDKDAGTTTVPQYAGSWSTAA